MKGFWKDLGIGMLIIVVIITGCLTLANSWAKFSCEKTTAVMEIPHKYSFWTDCMVEYGGQWVPLENFRVMDGR